MLYHQAKNQRIQKQKKLQIDLHLYMCYKLLPFVLYQYIYHLFEKRMYNSMAELEDCKQIFATTLIVTHEPCAVRTFEILDRTVHTPRD